VPRKTNDEAAMLPTPIPVEQVGVDVKQLRACINDLIGVVALPAIWSGTSPAEIVRTLLDALLSMLDLEFVYLRLKDSFGEPPFDVVRAAHSRTVTGLSQRIGELLKNWLGGHLQIWPRVVRGALGDRDLSIILLPLGLDGEIGVLVAGSRRVNFPVRTERLLLSVAANHAALGLQGAHLLSEQKRIAEELDQKVAKRTEELAAANRELQKEIAKEQSLAAENLKAYEEIAALKAKLEIENTYLQDEIRNQHNFEEILGNSPELLKLLDRVQSTAPTDANVLIIGETGSGKELIARAIHSRSARRNRPLVKVNCGAIPSGLVESELFGHVKGAFTSASERRIGRFELANNGTLFLDEVGELPLETQVKLLRVLQEQEFEPVGSSRTIKVNVRIIAATNRDLAKAVQSGGFRSDLYYRLNVIPLRVPALRDRKSDIPQLVIAFLQQSAKRMGKSIQSVSQETMRLLVDYSWPGNIRELQNVIERGVVLSNASILKLGADLLPIEASERSTEPIAVAETKASDSLEEVQRQHILRVLERTGWVISGPTGAGAILDIHPNTLRSLMNRLGIRRAL
jgi:transcriptional regulator with GAF, ATPase, and Fis domain